MNSAADRGDERERGTYVTPAAAPRRFEPVALEPLHRRVERQRQEERDQDPRQHVAGDPDHLEDDRDRDDDSEQRQHGPRPEADEPLRDHPLSIAPASDVRRAALGLRTRTRV